MCGRYVNVSKIEEVEKRFNVKVEHTDPDDFYQYRQDVNVSPGTYAPVITNERPDTLQFYQFGFTPFWAKKKMYVINARSEGDHNKENDPTYRGAKGILQKPMFRKSIRSKRCLVVVDAFIEGPKEERLKKPYIIYRRDRIRPFALAGIWDRWINKDSGEEHHSFAILTTTANDLLQKVGHHRSPVVLDRDTEQWWLSDDTELNIITSLMEPFPSTDFNAYPISPAIRSPKAKDIELLKPVGERIYPEYEYIIYNELQLFGMGESRARMRKKDEED
jgi:putative SOS response-associated peptidase YedK